MVNWLKISVFVFLVLGMTQLYNLRDITIRILAPLLGLESMMISKSENLISSFQKENLKKRKCSYLLIGDSHTYALNRYISSNSIVNRAINGETTRGLLRRWDRTIANITTQKIIIQIGYNDFKYRSVEATFSNYVEIIKKLQDKKLFLVSLFPVKRKRTIINSRIIAFNNLIKTLCEKSNDYTYVDVYSNLVDPKIGGIIPELTYDGVHLNPEGNRIYIRRLEQVIKVDLFSRDYLIHADEKN